MAERTVAVRLLAVTSQFSTAMKAAGRDVGDVQRKIAAGDQNLKRSQEQVSRGMLLVGGAAVAGAGMAVRAFAKFDRSMSNVKAVSGASAEQMGALRDAAIEAGKATVFSASEAADATAELAKAGVSTADILGGALRGSLDLAAAGQLELADAATIAAQAMNIFKLRGSDVTHIADVLAAGANKSAADVKQLGDALRQGGLVAAQTGAGLEETVGTLSAFADSALVGSDAGTSFKTMLQRLLPQSKEAADAMESIGFSAFDAQGKFVGLEKVAGGLQQGLGKLSQEQRAATLNTIFGSDAVRAASVLYEQGAAGIADYTAAVDDQGAAAKNAATQLDNLTGDLEAFKGSVETALIQSGSSANGVLRGLTQSATGMVNSFADAPPAVQSTVTAVAGLGGAALVAVGAIGTLAPKVTETRKALESMGRAGELANVGLGKVARGVGIASAAFIAYEAATAFLAESSSDLAMFTQEIEAASGSTTQSKIKGLTAEMEKLKRESNEGWANGEVLGYGVRLGLGAYNAGRRVFELEDRIKALKHEQKLQRLASDGATDSIDEFGGAVEDAIDPITAAADALVAYKDALADMTAIDAYTAVAELTKAFQGANKEIERNEKVTADDRIEIGGYAREVRNAAAAVLDQEGGQKKANRVLAEGRDKLAALAEKAGYSAEKADELARKLLKIEPPPPLPIRTPGMNGAITNAARLRDILLNLPSSVSIPVRIGVANKLGANPGIDGSRAMGGPVRRGGLYKVGEQGVEFFRPRVDGDIIPSGPTAGIMAAARSGSAMSGASDAGGQGGGAAFMRDLIVNAPQEQAATVIPRVLDAQMYRLGRA